MVFRLDDQRISKLVENPQEIARRFERVADIRDMGGFQDALVALFDEQSRARQGEADEASAKLKRLTDEMVLEEPWHPTETQLQQGRAVLLKELARPENLSVADFARLAGKSRAQIYNDINAKRYLSISRGGPRGARLPDFQLRNEGQALVELLLKKAKDVDAWTLYTLLTEPNEAINGKVPGYVVQHRNVKQMAALLLSQLGFQEEVPQLG
jgi:hypothetical protein